MSKHHSVIDALADVRALLADLGVAEKALTALAQQAQPVHQFRRRLCADCPDACRTPEKCCNFGCQKATPPAPQVPAPVDELPDLNPEDFVVAVVFKQLGGFAPVTAHGVRVTHKPSRVSVVVDSERSQHRNRQLALEALRSILALRPTVGPMTDDTARLDYLQKRGATVDLVAGIVGPTPMRFRIGGFHTAVNSDIRKAIDAARGITAKAEGGA